MKSVKEGFCSELRFESDSRCRGAGELKKGSESRLSTGLRDTNPRCWGTLLRMPSRSRMIVCVDVWNGLADIVHSCRVQSAIYISKHSIRDDRLKSSF